MLLGVRRTSIGQVALGNWFFRNPSGLELDSYGYLLLSTYMPQLQVLSGGGGGGGNCVQVPLPWPAAHQV